MVTCLPIVNLNNFNWNRTAAKFSGFELDENGNAVFAKEGYIFYCNGRNVNYVVFTKDYQKEIIGHIKVGTDLATIQKTLGEPTFITKGGIGYKTRENYVFYYEDEICVYPKFDSSSKKLEDLINSYFEKTYTKGKENFVAELTNKYIDFVAQEDEETKTTTLTSIARQMILKLDGIGNIEVELYNGASVSEDKTKEYIEQKRYVQKNEDLVEIVEKERVSGN
ncbi:MAG: hypothetical protein IJ867_05435 [Clostridia bacterium]|nr:hypothetical protein [Clostridia bacterium]